MSMLAKWEQLNQQKAALEKELANLENDERLQREVEFKEKLESLMKEFNKSASDVIDLLSPSGHSSKSTAKKQGRRKRKLKIYKNPQTGEVIETRGGNHKTLKSWKDEYGSETVESWLVRTED